MRASVEYLVRALLPMRRGRCFFFHHERGDYYQGQRGKRVRAHILYSVEDVFATVEDEFNIFPVFFSPYLVLIEPVKVAASSTTVERIEGLLSVQSTTHRVFFLAKLVGSPDAAASSTGYVALTDTRK